MTKFRDMPKNVRRFVLLWLGTYPIDFLSWFLAPIPPDGPEISPFTYKLVTLVLLTAILALDLVFVWLTAWRRQNWARWVALVLCLLSLPWAFEDVAGPALWLTFPVAIMNVAALYFIFTGDARPWFQKGPNKGTIAKASD